MKLSDWSFLADENIQPAVVEHIRSGGADVLYVTEEEFRGASDIELLQFAFDENRIIITHDSDFGKLAFIEGFPFKGIVYLRPGHFDANVSIISWNALNQANLELSPPFILVAQNQGDIVKIRLRNL